MARVLVIDDEKNIRKMTWLTLEHAGHKVTTAEDGEEGLQLFGDGTDWDVTLTDERLPGLEGHLLVREVRKRAPSARIIMMTAFATFDLAADVLAAGATDFLRKPFSADLLRGTVALALQRSVEPLPTISVGVPDAIAPTPPLVQYLINGVRMWPVAVPSDTPVLPGFAAQRAFHLLDADTLSTTTCVVGITPHVMELAREETGQKFPAGAPLWDTVCRLALSNVLWEREGLPDRVPVYELSPAQRHAVRQSAGLPFLLV